jgi:hypothetical protein
MANSLTALSPKYWSAIMGVKLYKQNVFRNIASFREEGVLKNGQIVDRPYRADIYVQAYTKGTALTAQDITATSDELTVNKIFAALIYVDDVDKIQNKWDAAEAWTAETVTRLSNQIDADCLFEAYNASDTIDYNDLDSTQTAGVPVALTVSNVVALFTTTARKLSVNNVPEANRFFILSPQVKQVLITYLAGRESILGDRTGEAGNIGRYMGFELYESNNVTGMIRWTPTDDPSDTETLVVNGITFTFVTTIGTTAGNVLRGTSVAATIDNLVALINAPATSTAQGIAFATTNLAALQRGFFAVDGTTYIDIYVKGSSYITSTDTADATYTYQKQLLLAGEKKAIDLVIQKEPSVKMASTVSAGKDGMNILPKTLYGVKTFEDMKSRILRVEIDSSSY